MPSVAAKKLALERMGRSPVSGMSIGCTSRAPPAWATARSGRISATLSSMSRLQEVRDQEVQARGARARRGAPQKTYGRLDIEVVDGVVTLNGSVPGLESKRLAGVIAWWIPGTRDVINGIVVDPRRRRPGPHCRGRAHRARERSLRRCGAGARRAPPAASYGSQGWCRRKPSASGPRTMPGASSASTTWSTRSRLLDLAWRPF